MVFQVREMFHFIRSGKELKTLRVDSPSTFFPLLSFPREIERTLLAEKERNVSKSSLQNGGIRNPLTLLGK